MNAGIEKTPILSGRQNKQFAIPFKKKEVVRPTKEGGREGACNGSGQGENSR